ncbi:MAG: response regulator [Candidatus Omnitrophica bacterium]|jgi:ATP-dependent Lon protease|nr:response regulator [Candidatus Omnitrophota bacterium]
MSSISTRILVVDDEPEVGETLKRYLSVRNFQVTTAYNAETALRMLESHPADIVILDILMHGMNGQACARIIKEKYPNTKIMVVTAYPDMAFSLSREITLHGCFIKPAGIEEIYHKLSNN